MSRRRELEREGGGRGGGRRLEDDTADAFIKGVYGLYRGRGRKRSVARYSREGGTETARGRVRRSAEETRRKNDEPEIISGVAERSRPNADVPSLYEKLMTSRSRQFPSSRYPQPFFTSLAPSLFPLRYFFSFFFLSFLPLPLSRFYLSPVSLYCQPSFDDLACLDEI